MSSALQEIQKGIRFTKTAPWDNQGMHRRGVRKTSSGYGAMQCPLCEKKKGAGYIAANMGAENQLCRVWGQDWQRRAGKMQTPLQTVSQENEKQGIGIDVRRKMSGLWTKVSYWGLRFSPQRPFNKNVLNLLSYPKQINGRIDSGSNEMRFTVCQLSPNSTLWGFR